MAAGIAALLSALRASEKAEEELAAEARELGERVDFGPHPEMCRREPIRWRVSYPNPEGTGVIGGTPESAPRGAIRWEGDTSVPNRPDVRLERRGGEWPDSLVSTACSLAFGTARITSIGRRKSSRRRVTSPAWDTSDGFRLGCLHPPVPHRGAGG
jgi:hypothetical protein